MVLVCFVKASRRFSDVYKVAPVKQNSSDVYQSGNGLFQIGRMVTNQVPLNNGMRSGAVCFPKGPDVDSYQNIWKAFFISVSSLSEKPEEICEVIKACFTTWQEDGSYHPEIQENLIPGQFTYTKRDADAVGDALPPGKLDFLDAFTPVTQVWNKIVDDLFIRYQPVAQVMDTYNPQVLDGIRSIVGEQ